MSLINKFLGIEIGGTKLQLAITATDGNILEGRRHVIDPQKGASGIRAQVIAGLEQLDQRGDIAAIGVGFGGPVNWNTGTINVSHQINGWENFNLSSWLNELTKKTVVIDNDANVAALAEAVFGCGKGHERVFYVTIGSGIGGGMIINGEIYHGRLPGEVEIGHIRMDKNGSTLESKCSGWAVNKKVRNYIQNHSGSILAQVALNNSLPEATFLKTALEEDCEGARQILREVADDLAFALSHVVHLFHPDIIIIGGGLSLLRRHLCVPVEEKLSNYIMKAFLPIPPVQIAVLGENVVPIGAAELAKHYWLKTKCYS